MKRRNFVKRPNKYTSYSLITPPNPEKTGITVWPIQFIEKPKKRSKMNLRKHAAYLASKKAA